jgi:hypothetical protein
MTSNAELPEFLRPYLFIIYGADAHDRKLAEENFCRVEWDCTAGMPNPRERNGRPAPCRAGHNNGASVATGGRSKPPPLAPGCIYAGDVTGPPGALT